jgi:hypothetical protein
MPGLARLARLARMPRGREGKSDMITGGTVEAVNSKISDKIVSLGRRGTNCVPMISGKAPYLALQLAGRLLE